ncbi:DUF1593 domain-containing protein [Nibrella saemangeumensis]|uniref:DUF1593 domain-containing protein n=1 Tax=Nibrella saemangeumensis TaxID=1084526 RepID=A0ABP8MGG6_9BACT
MQKKHLLFISLLAVLSQFTATAQPQPAKPRTIITTDGEADDVNSFIRLLLYSNELDIVGLVYSSSQWHYAGDGNGTAFTSEMPNTAKLYGERTELRWPGTTWLQDCIMKYEKVYNNLVKHDKGYPAPDHLMEMIKVGNIEFEGEMSKTTEGSDFIKKVLLDNNPGPVYLQIWGGTNTVARALKSIEEEYKGKPEWPEIAKKVSGKAVLYTILDQDATYRKYIAPNWPQIKVMYNTTQFGSLAYGWPKTVPAELQASLSGKWFAENIKFKHGPLLEGYYLWGDGEQVLNDQEHTQGSMEEAEKAGRSQYDFLSEGDSPAFLSLLDVGLRSLENPAFGGWGGRLLRSPKNKFRWEDGKAVADLNPYTKQEDTAYPQTRWINAIQNDFAARADWCVQDYKEANHPPVVTLTHEPDVLVKPGGRVNLSASATDPDGDALTYRWWQYEEVDGYEKKIRIVNADKPKAYFYLPEDAPLWQTIHIILEVTDSRTPALTRYQRVVAKIVKELPKPVAAR